MTRPGSRTGRQDRRAGGGKPPPARSCYGRASGMRWRQRVVGRRDDLREDHHSRARGTAAKRYRLDGESIAAAPLTDMGTGTGGSQVLTKLHASNRTHTPTM